MKEEFSNKSGKVITPILIGLIVGVIVAMGVMIGMHTKEDLHPCETELFIVRLDFDSMVGKREYNVGRDTDYIKARMNLREMYVYDGEMVLPFTGIVDCSEGSGECTIKLCARLFLKDGKICVGSFRLGEFYSHDLDLGSQRDYVGATLFLLLKKEVAVSPFEVGQDCISIHRVYNDFVELKKIKRGQK